MIRNNYSFPKDNRIRKSKDFKKIQSKSKRKNSKYFTLLYSPGRTRLGLTISTKVGNSPERNYIKRCVREFFRRNKHLFNNLDVIVIGKPGMETLSYNEIVEELIKTIQKK